MKGISKLKDDARKHEQREEWDKAVAAYLQVLADAESGEVELPLYNRVGDLYARMGRQEEAVRYYEQAADRYAEVGLYNNAIALCNKALRYVPGRLQVLRRLGQYSASQGFLTDARSYLIQYAERSFAGGDHDAALKVLADYARISGDAEVREFMGRKLHELGRTSDAIAELKRAYALRLGAGQAESAAGLRRDILAIEPSALDDELAGGTVPVPPQAVVLPAPVADLPDLPDESPPQAVTAEAPALVPTMAELSAATPGELVPEAAGLLEGFETTSLESGGAGAESQPLSDLESAPEFEVSTIELPRLDGLEAPAETEAPTQGQLPELLLPEEPTTSELAGIGATPLPDLELPAPGEEPEPLPLLPELTGLGLTAGPVAEAGLGATQLPAGPPGVEAPDLPEDTAALPELEEPELVEDTTPLPELEEPELVEDITPLPELEEPELVEDTTPLPELEEPELVEDATPLPELEEPEPVEDATPLPEPEEPALIESTTPLPELAEPALVEDTTPRPELEEPALVEDATPLPELAEQEPAEEIPLPEPEPEPEPEAVAAATALPEVEGPSPVEQIAALPEPDESKLEAPPEELLPAVAESGQEPAEVPAYVDLRALVIEPEGPPADTRFTTADEAQTGDEERDFASLLSQFKRKVAEHVDPADAAAHYDLGLAFKDMGLLDEAIGELQLALQVGDMRLKVIEELGLCFLLKKEYSIAEKVLRRALVTKHDDEIELLGVYYHLGRVYEELGKPDLARDAFERVLALDINFGDVSTRIARL